jgi:hypothetical protein
VDSIRRHRPHDVGGLDPDACFWWSASAGPNHGLAAGAPDDPQTPDAGRNVGVQAGAHEEIDHAGWGLADSVIAGRAHLADRSVEDHQRLVARQCGRRGEDRVESGLAAERGHLLADGVVVAREIRLVQIEPITHNGIGQVLNVEGLAAHRADTTANLEWVHAFGREVAEQLSPRRLLPVREAKTSTARCPKTSSEWRRSSGRFQAKTRSL